MIKQVINLHLKVIFSSCFVLVKYNLNLKDWSYNMHKKQNYTNMDYLSMCIRLKHSLSNR